MRKIRIMEHISLDGVIQHEDGEGFAHGGWTAPYRTPAGAEAVAEAQDTSPRKSQTPRRGLNTFDHRVPFQDSIRPRVRGPLS